MFGGSANGEGRFTDGYDFLLFHERLTPYREKHVIDSGRDVGSGHHTI
jgi:hypothetical protein